MGKRITKDAVPTGLSLSRDIYEQAHEYHSKLEIIYLRRTGKVHSFSSTLELLIRAGFEVMKTMDFDDVIEALQKHKVPENVKERAHERRARMLGKLSDKEVDDLIKHARRMK